MEAAASEDEGPTCLGGFLVNCDDGSNVFCNGCSEELEDCQARCPAKESPAAEGAEAISPAAESDDDSCLGGYQLMCGDGTAVLCNACEEDSEECAAKCSDSESGDDGPTCLGGF